MKNKKSITQKDIKIIIIKNKNKDIKQTRKMNNNKLKYINKNGPC